MSTAPLSPETVARLREDLTLLPPGPWQVWTSCSYRRIRGGERNDIRVLDPVLQNGDGHPDLSMPAGQLEALCRIINALRDNPALLSALTKQPSPTEREMFSCPREMSHLNRAHNQAASRAWEVLRREGLVEYLDQAIVRNAINAALKELAYRAKGEA